MEIRQAGTEDLDPILAILDGTVAWLVAQGRTGQWGTQPWTAQPNLVEKMAGRIERGEARVAVLDGEVVGVLSVSDTSMPYVAPAEEPELYVNLLATDRRHKGRDLGGALLREALAEARRRGVGLVRVDCYAGDDGKLPAFYRGQGFAEVGPFGVKRDGRPDWPGMLLAQRVD